MRLSVILTVLIALFGTSGRRAFGQWSSEREVTIFTGDTIQLDSLSAFPGSLRVLARGELLADTLYAFDPVSSTLVFIHPAPEDTLVCRFRVFPFRLQPAAGRPEEYYDSGDAGRAFRPYTLGSQPDRPDPFGSSALSRSGSISRGIAFGNAQNLSVNSSLNLQLSGPITERYNLLASVTDDNIPIQPEGNTQQLQDFDQVYIQLSDDRSRLVAGDFILRRPAGYFLNYFKRAQGAYVQAGSVALSENPDGPRVSVEASASVSKGQFARNVIQGIEGNQGPYRLTGANNELFIVVLAGTEAVYIDGRLMERGQDKDYVIDYNAAEITFTPRQFITKDRRITVEFQYSDKRYARPLIHSSLVLDTRRTRSFLNVYSESDARNQPLQQELRDSDKRILAAAGDNPLEAVAPGIDSTGFSSGAVLYALVDSLGYDSVLVYSVHPDSALYRVTFSLVGQGAGDYVEDGFTANGRKFRWVAPEPGDNGVVRQGSYAPVVILYAPRKKQFVHAGIEWKTRAGARNSAVLSAEGALSVDDQNTFSARDGADDLGFASRYGLTWTRHASADSSGNRPDLEWKMLHEFTSVHFSRIERFREVEFERNWNVLNLPLAGAQHIGTGEFSLVFPRSGRFGAGMEWFSSGSAYTGRKAHFYSRLQTRSGWRAFVQSSLLDTRGLVSSSFLRHKSDLSRKLGSIRIGFRDEHELNRQFASGRDSLLSQSYQFYDWEVSVGNADTTRFQASAFYRDRWDERPAPDLTRASRADHYGAVIGFSGTAGNRLRLQASNRRLRIIDPELISQPPENTLLMRGEYSFRWWKGLVQGTTFYEVGSGLEQRREFIYLEVPAGQGNFVWIDYNGDGVRDLNEFEVAQFAYEANFIRSFVQTNTYVRTYSNQFSQTFWLTPSAVWKSPESRAARFLSKWSNQSSYRVERKTQREDRSERLNPFITSISDSALLALNASFRNVIFYNKSNPVFGADFTLQQVGGKSLLSTGFESRSDGFSQVAVRWNFFQAFTLLLEGRSGEKKVRSDFLAGRNYTISSWSARPRINWQPSTSARLSCTGEYSSKTNREGMQAEEAVIRKAGLEWTVNSSEKGLVQANVQVVSIRYSGAPNNSLAFDMLEGLVPGVNVTWGASIQRTVARNLQLNLQYNGRKPGELRAIHSGGMQLRAFF